MDTNEQRRQVERNEKMKNLPPIIIEGDGFVVTEKNHVIGSNGSLHWFLLREKYIFTGETRVLVKCNPCSNGRKEMWQNCWIVDINGETFLEPKEFGVFYNQPIDNQVANKEKYEQWLEPNIFYPKGNDYITETERVTGMPRKVGPDINPILNEDLI